jgi:transcriptional regulator with XRE-family HTH domain
MNAMPPKALNNADARFERLYSQTRGECLRKMRLQEGLTLREAAARVSISYGHLSDLEHDRHGLTLTTATALMELYGGSLRILAALQGK